MPSNDRYASFMLRLQRAQNDNRPVWLTCIQSTKTGELRWFPTIDAFVNYLREEFGESGETTSLSEEKLSTTADRQVDPLTGE